MPKHNALRVAVIGGGANDEHDVSLASAASVARSVRSLGMEAVPLTIDRAGGWHDELGTPLAPAEAVTRISRCDVAFPVIHGVDGEDGAAAGLLVMIGMPMVGSPVRAGALAMDKWVTKLVSDALGIATAPGAIVPPDHDGSLDELLTDLTMPLVVKPTAAGSSNGVTRVDTLADLPSAIEEARRAGGTVLVESFVTGREVDIAIFRDASGALRAGATLQIEVPEDDVFDRESKYDGTARFTVPASITADEHAALDQAARSLYDALGCSGVARFDFFVTATGVVLNEVNTVPGFTEQSQVPRMYEAVGLDYTSLVGELIHAATRAEYSAPRR